MLHCSNLCICCFRPIISSTFIFYLSRPKFITTNNFTPSTPLSHQIQYSSVVFPQHCLNQHSFLNIKFCPPEWNSNINYQISQVHHDDTHVVVVVYYTIYLLINISEINLNMVLNCLPLILIDVNIFYDIYFSINPSFYRIYIYISA